MRGKRLVDWATNGLPCHAARHYRRLLPFTTFVGITGSCGKTTTTELIGAVLALRGITRVGKQFKNTSRFVARTLLTVPPWSVFCVHELGAWTQGVLGDTLRFFRPDVGVVTLIREDHRQSYRNLEATAREKAKLVEALPADGVAILNADDPRVPGMREVCPCRSVTYGFSEEATVRGSQVESTWPKRLSMTVEHGKNRVRVQTRLVGEQWASSTLAAIATGLALGIPIHEAAKAIATVEPVEGRMSVHETAGGITFVRDDWKAPLWTTDATLRIAAGVQGRRKAVIFGHLLDFSGKSSKVYPRLARAALPVASKVIFVGPNAHSALRAREGQGDRRIEAFDSVAELKDFLDGYLEDGDFVLLKGTVSTDHLERLVLSRTTAVECWRNNCGRTMPCTACKLLNRPTVQPSSSRAPK